MTWIKAHVHGQNWTKKNPLPPWPKSRRSWCRHRWLERSPAPVAPSSWGEDSEDQSHRASINVNGWFIMDPIKIDDFRVPPFSETSIWSTIYIYTYTHKLLDFQCQHVIHIIYIYTYTVYNLLYITETSPKTSTNSGSAPNSTLLTSLEMQHS